MSRRLQVRDIHDPIARIVREHLTPLGVAAIYRIQLVRELQDAMNDLVQRAANEGYEAGQGDLVKGN